MFELIIDLFCRIFLGFSPIKRRQKKELRNNQSPTFLPSFGVFSVGDSELHSACRKNDIQKVRELISKNVNINSLNHKKETPIMIAVKYKNLFIFRALVSAKARLDLVNSNNESVYDIALKSNHETIINEINKLSSNNNTQK